MEVAEAVKNAAPSRGGAEDERSAPKRPRPKRSLKSRAHSRVKKRHLRRSAPKSRDADADVEEKKQTASALRMALRDPLASVHVEAIKTRPRAARLSGPDAHAEVKKNLPRPSARLRSHQKKGQRALLLPPRRAGLAQASEARRYGRLKPLHRDERHPAADEAL
jgi:hypothetical protein